MRTERDWARCVAVFVGPRRELAVRAPSIVLASKSTPGVWVPSLRFSFRDHLSLVGRRKYRTPLSLSVCTAQKVIHMSFFSSGLSGESAPVWVHRPRLAFAASVRSKKKKKKNSKKKVRRRTDTRRQQQRGGKFQRALNVLNLHEDNLPLWLR